MNAIRSTISAALVAEHPAALPQSAAVARRLVADLPSRRHRTARQRPGWWHRYTLRGCSRGGAAFAT